MKKAISVLMAVVLLALLCCACGETETTTVRLNEVTHSVFYAPQYVALELGFFEEEGLQIELANGGGADKVMTAVLTDQADIGLAGPESCIYVYNQGKEDYPIVFAQLTKRDGSFLVGRTDETFSWEILKGSTIIGGRAGGVPEMTLEYVMRQNGVVPGEDATVDTTVQFNMMAGAFTGGNGDYVALFEPTATGTLTQVVQRYKDIDAWNATPVMEQSALERLETVMETAGVLTHDEWVDFGRLVDNSYAQKAA